MQVISFLALLKQRGIKGPHLIVVPWVCSMSVTISTSPRYRSSTGVESSRGSRLRYPSRLNTLVKKNGPCSGRHFSILREQGSGMDGRRWSLRTPLLKVVREIASFLRKSLGRFVFSPVPIPSGGCLLIDPQTCVFDEGHQLKKNFEFERYRCLIKCQVNWKLLLTGTPLQNNLQELAVSCGSSPHRRTGVPGKLMVPNELHSSRPICGKCRVSSHDFEVKGRYQIHHACEGAGLQSQENDDTFRLAPTQRPGMSLNPWGRLILMVNDPGPWGSLKKVERIEWCEMTALQKKLHDDALRRSRKTVMDLTEEPSDSAETKSGKKAPKKGKENTRKKNKCVENSANSLVDLRKAASHPMQLRPLFRDEIVPCIARVF